MKTSIPGQAGICPTGTEGYTQTGDSGGPHLEVTSNGTETGNLLNGPLVDLHAFHVTWQEGVCGEPLESTLGDFLDHVEQGTYAREVEAIRKRYNRVLNETGDPKKAKDAVSDLKTELPAITPSGLFDGRRKRDCLVQYTKEICYDIDHCEPARIMAAAPQCPYVDAAFVSPTDTGVKLFVPVDAADDGSNHLELWQAGKRMVKQYFGVDVDESRKDITGLCFISAGQVYRNLSAKPVTLAEFNSEPRREPPAGQDAQQRTRPQRKPDPLEEKAQPETNGKPLFDLDASLAPEDAADARKTVLALRYIDPTPEPVWREVGMALKGQWGDAAWDLFDAWSANGGGYDEQENRARWDSFRDDPDAGITLGTIFHYAKKGGWTPYDKKAVVLPTRSSSDFCRAVYRIMAPTHSVFLQGGQMVCIETINGQPEIVPVEAHKGIRLFEEHIQFLKRTVKDGEQRVVPVALVEKPSKLLVKGVQPGELPELKGVTFCPTLVGRTLESGDQTVQVSGPGYVPETGWFNASQVVVTLPEIRTAVTKLKWLYREFVFPTPGDRSRALVYPIGVALKLSGWIKGFVPLDFGTANDQQSGKGTRQRITAALFNRRMEVITQSEHHIGGTAEMFKSACLAGKTFIQLDNFDHFQCREMEAFLTGQNVRMRDAYGHSRSVDPASFFVFLSSNGLAARRDLALRSWFIRIRKKPKDFRWHQYQEGGIVEHVLARQAECLGCIYAIAAEWWRRGCPRTEELGHDFRDFTQACDWIAQNILEEAPVMDGHAEAQEQYADAGKVFFLRLWDILEMQGKLHRFFRAGQLATTAFRYSVPIPGLSLRFQGDENAGAKLIGSVAAEMFEGSAVLDLGQRKTVERREALPAEDWDSLNLPERGKPSPCYVFRKAAEQSSDGAPRSDPEAAENPEQPAGRETQDQVTAFRNNLLSALADVGKPPPCNMSTQEIGKLFDACSVDSAGRWMAKLAIRYPKRFIKADTDQWRGWRILG